MASPAAAAATEPIVHDLFKELDGSVFKLLLGKERVLHAAEQLRRLDLHSGAGVPAHAASAAEQLRTALHLLNITLRRAQQGVLQQLIWFLFVFLAIREVLACAATLQSCMDADQLISAAAEEESAAQSDLASPSLQQAVRAPDSTSTPHLSVKMATATWDQLVLGQRLGSGSYGSVFAGDWNGQAVAVKCVDDEELRDDELVQQLVKEVQMLAENQHKHVVQCYAVCYQPPAIIMQWCEGGSLYNKLHHLPVIMAARVLRDVAGALRHLHTHRPPISALVHGDIRSPNVLLSGHNSASWCAKLADFGLAQWLSLEGTAQTPKITNHLWVAPELLEQDQAALMALQPTAYDTSTAADVWAFGAVIYEVVTGSWPYETDDVDPRMLNMVADFGNPHLRFGPLTWPDACGLLHGFRDPLFMEYLKPLFTACVSPDPKQRPSFKHIHEQLQCLCKLLQDQQQPVQQGRGMAATGAASTNSVTGQRQQHQQQQQQQQHQQQQDLAEAAVAAVAECTVMASIGASSAKQQHVSMSGYASLPGASRVSGDMTSPFLNFELDVQCSAVSVEHVALAETNPSIT